MVSANFTPRSILPVNPSAEEIFKSFSPQNYQFVLRVIRGVLSITDFSTDGKIHYKLQSPSGQLLINERALLDKLNVEGLFSYYGEDEVLGIVTLGNINVDVLKKVESYLNNATRQAKAETVQKPSNLKQRYNQLLGEMTPKETLLDSKERYRKLLREIRSNQSSPTNIFQSLATKIEITKLPELRIKRDRQIKKYVPRKDNLLLTKDLKADITIGKLSTYNDGTIRYGKNILEIRNQLKDLCRLFMRNPNRLLTIDDIKDEIIKADKRTLISFATIAKYVSELHNLLKIHFGKDVIFNQKEEGWYFKPPE